MLLFEYAPDRLPNRSFADCFLRCATRPSSIRISSRKSGIFVPVYSRHRGYRTVLDIDLNHIPSVAGRAQAYDRSHWQTCPTRMVALRLGVPAVSVASTDGAAGLRGVWVHGRLGGRAAVLCDAILAGRNAFIGGVIQDVTH